MLKYFLICVGISTTVIVTSSCRDDREISSLRITSEDTIDFSIRDISEDNKDTLFCLDTAYLIKSAIKYKQVTFTGRKYSKWVLSFDRDVDLHATDKIRYFLSSEPFEKCDEPAEYVIIDSLVFHYTDGQTWTKVLPEGAAGTSLKDINDLDSRVVDINSDGYEDVDIGLNEVSGGTNAIRLYFIFDTDLNKFTNGITLANAQVDPDNKLVYSSWNGGAAGKISTRLWQEFVGYDSLRLRRQEVSDYDRALSKYIKVTTIVDELGQISTQVDTLN